MEEFKNALDRVRASEKLKQKTADYIKSIDANVISIDAVRIKTRPVGIRRLVIAACAAVVLCALPIGGYAVYRTPTSYLSVDINPSVELGINTFGKVVSVTPYNADGESVVSGLDLLNKSVESAVRLIVRSASQSGFIKDDGSSFISFTTETTSDTQAEQLETDAEAGAQDAIDQENDTATVAAEHIGLDRRDDAIALGISPGKLNLIEKLQALDSTITVDAYKDATVSEIQKKFVELKKEHNGQNNGKKGEDAETSPSPSQAPSPSPSATASPDPTVSASTGPSSSVPPDTNAKPSHGNSDNKNTHPDNGTNNGNGVGNKNENGSGNNSHTNNGKGNDKKNETAVPPSTMDGGSAAISPSITAPPADTGNNSNNGNSGNNGNNGNSGNNGNGGGNGNSGKK